MGRGGRTGTRETFFSLSPSLPLNAPLKNRWHGGQSVHSVGSYDECCSADGDKGGTGEGA